MLYPTNMRKYVLIRNKIILKLPMCFFFQEVVKIGAWKQE